MILCLLLKKDLLILLSALLKEQEHIEANNPFISQVAIMYLINNFRVGDRDED